MRTNRLLTVGAGVLVLTALGVVGFRPTGPTADDQPLAEPIAGRESPSTHASVPEREPVPAGTEHPTSTTDSASTHAAAADLLVVWARGGLPDDAHVTATALPDVVAVTRLRSDVVGLVGTRAPDGSVVDAPADGFRIPVTVLGLDPGLDAAFAGESAGFEPPAPGQVLLSETSAALRRLGVGGHLDLQGLPDLEVVGIVADRMVRGAEVVLHADDADAAGLRSRGALFVAHRATGADRVALVEALEALIPDDTVGRVVDGDVTSRVPLVLPMTEVKRRFGEFAYRPRNGDRTVDIDPGWVARHIVEARVPLLGTVRCHEAIVDDLVAALTEIDAAGLGDWIDPRGYGGCFLGRHISTERERLSRHSWGIAIDINVDLSLPGLGPVPPDEVIETFGRHGFRWGGDFATPDNHHWEWVGDAAMTRPGRR